MDRSPLSTGRQTVMPRIAATRILLLFAALMLTIWLGWRGATPPPPLSAIAPASSFSAGRAIGDVRAIAMRPHPTGSADDLRIAAYLESRLVQIGLQTQTRHYLIDDTALDRLRRWSGGTSRASELTDLIGILPGRDRNAPAVVLMAHYDTVWGSPGGGDDSAGVAAILEIARAVKARGIPARDLILLFTDGEEIGFSGARAFWAGDALADRAGVVLNFEARGAGGRAVMFETGAGNGAMMKAFGLGVGKPVSNSLAVLAYRVMPNRTDFTPVRQRGLPGFNFAILDRAAFYHSPLATRDRLDPRSLQDLGDQGLGIASALVFARMLPAKAADAVFFDVLGCHFIEYRPATGWLPILVSAIALAIAGEGLRRARMLTIVEALAGAGAAIWLSCHAILALTLFNLISGSGRHPNYYDRLAALGRLEPQAVLLCLAAIGGFLVLRAPARRWLGAMPAVALTVFGLLAGGPHQPTILLGLAGGLMGLVMPRRGVSLWGGWIGAIALLLISAAIVQIEQPLAAWLFAWPALVLSVAAAIVAWIDPRFVRTIGLVTVAIAAVATSAPLIPIAHLVFLGLGGPFPQAMAAFVPMFGVAFWPLARTAAWRPMLAATACALLAAGVIAIHVRTAPLAPSVPAYSIGQ